MKTEIYSINDVKAKIYGQPFYANNTEVAQRSFQQVINETTSPFNKSPEDYTLFHIGSFDASTGLITESVPQSLGNGLEYYVTPKIPAFTGEN